MPAPVYVYVCVRALSSRAQIQCMLVFAKGSAQYLWNIIVIDGFVAAASAATINTLVRAQSGICSPLYVCPQERYKIITISSSRSLGAERILTENEICNRQAINLHNQQRKDDIYYSSAKHICTLYASMLWAAFACVLVCYERNGKAFG